MSLLLRLGNFPRRIPVRNHCNYLGSRFETRSSDISSSGFSSMSFQRRAVLNAARRVAFGLSGLGEDSNSKSFCCAALLNSSRVLFQRRFPCPWRNVASTVRSSEKKGDKHLSDRLSPSSFRTRYIPIEVNPMRCNIRREQFYLLPSCD